jgi:DUF917 family protein
MEREWILTQEEIEPLLEGLAIQGTGGGGSPEWGRQILENEFRRGRTMRVVDPNALPDGAQVACGGIMGSVKALELITFAELLEGWEQDFVLIRAFSLMAKLLGRPIEAVVPFEVGGLNTPVILSLCARMGIPTVDGDALGRSAPETQMTSFIGHGVSLTPMPLIDARGNAVVVLEQTSPTYADEIGRWVVTRGGGLGGNSHYAMSGLQLKQAVIPNTISGALKIGQAMLQARRRGEDPVLAVAQAMGGKVYFYGVIGSMREKEREGFYLTVAELAGSRAWAGRTAEITIMNEAMLLSLDGKTTVIFPDLICMLDPQSGRGLMSVELHAGMEIAVLGVPCHPRLREAVQDETGRRSFAPARYGYPELDYYPMEELASD